MIATKKTIIKNIKKKKLKKKEKKKTRIPLVRFSLFIE